MAEGNSTAAPADASADAAYGALLGACVGDAAGAVLEFIYNIPTAAQVEHAMSMPGGGVWGVGPGQVTDDSELAMCLAQALKVHPASAGKVPLDDIAYWYGKWLHSPPFDIGDTTKMALQVVNRDPTKEGLGSRMQQAAAQFNQLSLSNGCLMRITPMAIWAHKLGVEGIAAAAAADTALTHPNETAQVASGAYCIAIAHLINNPKDAVGAMASVKGWLQQGPDSAATVLEWLQESEQDGPGPEVEAMEGFMKWGFVHAFRALKLQTPYAEAIQHILSLGGDTDTNAAIVGGLIGAYWGAAAIPAGMKDAVLARTVESPGRKRPDFLQTKQLPELFTQLYEASQA